MVDFGIADDELGGSSTRTGGLFGGLLSHSAETLNSPNHRAYSLSPVKPESRNLLQSPRKPARVLNKVPFKVLDAPDWPTTSTSICRLVQQEHTRSRTGHLRLLVECRQLVRDKAVRSQGTWKRCGDRYQLGQLGQPPCDWHAEGLGTDLGCREAKVAADDARSYPEGRSAGLERGDPHLWFARPSHLPPRRTCTDQHIRTLRAHRQEVCGLKWNTDTNQLASGGNDNRLIVWDALNEAPLHRFTEHTRLLSKRSLGTHISKASWHPEEEQ